MSTPRWSGEQIALARRLTHAMARRCALNEAVGIVDGWQGCGTAQARQDLAEHADTAEQDTEAARVAAIVDAEADEGTDPDWD